MSVSNRHCFSYSLKNDQQRMALQNVAMNDVIKLACGICILLFITGCAQVQTLPTANAMISSVKNNLQPIMRLVTGAGYVFGMYMLVMAIIKLKQYGEARTMMSSSHSLKGPLIYFLVGTAMLYFPTTMESGIITFFGNNDLNPAAYEDAAWDQNYAEAVKVLFYITQIIGVIAFMRGLIIWSHSASESSQPGNFSKGLTFIVAGIFCFNLYWFVNVIFKTLSIQSAIFPG